MEVDKQLTKTCTRYILRTSTVYTKKSYTSTSTSTALHLDRQNKVQTPCGAAVRSLMAVATCFCFLVAVRMYSSAAPPAPPPPSKIWRSTKLDKKCTKKSYTSTSTVRAMHCTSTTTKIQTSLWWHHFGKARNQSPGDRICYVFLEAACGPRSSLLRFA